MTIKETYNALKTMVETLGVHDYPIHVYGVNGNEFRVSAKEFCNMYEETILGTAYENATVHEYERAWGRHEIEFAMNSKVIAKMMDNIECDVEWLSEHFYEVYADDEPYYVEKEIYSL